MEKIKIHEKMLLAIGFVIAFISFYSFQTMHNPTTAKIDGNELILTVISDKPSITIVFDACLISDIYSKGQKNIKNQTTPFELVIKSDQVKFLFKKTSGNANVTYKVSQKNGSISASWPVSTILVSKDKMETFGL
ncbi:hypothetical protein [Flavobacterium sp. WC2509]|uniref:hypothetical protein n=1 Tax=Flavobacterium sp. WC2509 TaxID=3461406 RepID=UPI00404412E5